MKSILFILLFFSFSAMATSAGFEVAFEMSMKGAPKTLGKIRVKEGSPGSIAYAGNEIEVTAKEGEIHGHKGILMNFVVKKGNEVLAKPEILVYEKKQGQLTVNEASGEVLSLTVTATRINF